MKPNYEVPAVFLFVTMLMQTGLVFLFLFFFVGAGFGIYYESWPVFYFIWLGFPIFICFILTRKEVIAIHDDVAKTVNSLQGALGRVDYWKLTRGSGIALDVEARKIALRGTYNQKLVDIVVSPEKIRSIEAVSKEQEIIKVYGKVGGIQSTEIFNDNMAAMESAAQGTGLYFRLDDLDTPTVLVKLAYEDAEPWLMLFDKLADGSLETQDAPKEFPVP